MKHSARLRPRAHARIELVKLLSAIVCGFIVGWFTFFVLSIPAKSFSAISLGALAFFLYLLIFDSRLSAIRLIVKLPIKEDTVLLAVLFILFIILVLLSPQDISKLYRPWQELSFLAWLRFLLAIPLTSFLPGYIFLKFLDQKRELNKIESFSLSLLLSFLLVPLVGYIIMIWGLPITNYGLRAFMIFYTIILMSHFIFKLKMVSQHNQEDSGVLWRSPKISLILLMTIVSVLILVYSIQSQYGLVPGDEQELLGDSLIFEKSFPVNNGRTVPYPYWTSIFYALFFVLSGFPAVNAYIILHFFTIIPILSFYLFVSTFFKGDERVVAVGTVMFPLFAGFGWLYALILDPQKFQTTNDLLFLAGCKTYDIWNLANQFAYILDTPEIIGISCFLTALFLLRRNWIMRQTQCLLLPFIILLSYLSHATYDVIIFVVIFILHLFLSRRKIMPEYRRIALSILAVLPSICLIDFLAPGTVYTSDRFGTIGANSIFIIIISLLVFSVILSFLKERTTKNLNSICDILLNETIRTVFAILIISIFGICFIIYFATFQELVPMSSVVYTSFQWPWFIYPIRFGLVGVLAIGTAIYYLISLRALDTESMTTLLLWALTIIVACFLGKSIWFLPDSIKSMFLENKLQKYLWVSLCPLAAYGAVSLTSQFRKDPSGKIGGILFLSLLLVGGFTSVLLHVENFSISYRSVSLEEFQALDYLNKILTPNASVATITSANILHDYAGISVGRIFDRWWEPLLQSTSSPESVMKLLFDYNIRYLYIANRDVQYINKYPDSYLFKHLIKNLPIIFQNTEVKIYELPRHSPPSSASSVAVLVPHLVEIERPCEATINTVALFHFEDQGSIVKDFSRNHNDGEVFNGSYVGGKFGKGLLFNGVDTYINCGNDPTLSITGEIRIEAWVKLNEDWNRIGIICIKADGTDWPRSNYYFRIEADRRVTLIWGDGTAYRKITSVPQLDTGRWYHLAVEWDKIFINGVEVATTVEGGTPISHYASTYPLFIGGECSGKAPRGIFNGIIDELCIMNKSVSKYLDIERIFYYYYPIELMSLSNLNYSVISIEDSDLSTYSTIVIPDYNNIANIPRFLELCREGNTLIVLNTYDLGYFSDLFIENIENVTQKFDKISSDLFAFDITDIYVHKIKPIDDVQIVANYISIDGQAAPFALQRSIGRGKIIYIYLAPYLKALEGADDPGFRSSLWLKLKNIFALLPLNLPSYDDILNRKIYPPPGTHAAAARGISFAGNINFTFNDFVTPELGNLYAKTIKTDQYILNDVYIQNIEISGPSYSVISGKAGEIVDGSWSYALVRLHDSFNWAIHITAESKAVIRVLTGISTYELVIQNDTLEIVDITSQSNEGYAEILMKNLYIHMDGVLIFEKFYHRFPFWINQTGIRIVPYSDGGSISFNGKIEFPVRFSKPNVLYISDFIVYGTWEVPTILPPQQNIPWQKIILSPFLPMVLIAALVIVLYFKSYKVS